jgi:hypothetical protein
MHKNIKRKDLGDRAIADVIENAELAETAQGKICTTISKH